MTNMTGDGTRPRLSPKVRLRVDRRTGRELLLYPEMGLELNRTATEIARLCTGEWTVDDIVRHVAHRRARVSPGDITRDVRQFLKTLADRGLLRTDNGKARPTHRKTIGL
jgi:coenzyme PQQ biosynthesis protein PqqD